MNTHTDVLKVVVGPVIGKVTHNTARVLVEFDNETDVACYLTSNNGRRLEARMRSKAKIPIVFSFTGLEPKTFYTVSLSCHLDLKSSFWTLRENHDNPGNLKVGVVSCNEISHSYEKTPEMDLWGDLKKKVEKHEFDYMLHIGDQCYMDMGDYGESKEDPYRVCRFICETTPKELWESKRVTLIEVLRSEYRKTWSHYPLACVLANVPNLTICDDHELRDDWGFREEDWTPGTFDNFYGSLARQAYYEYQRQLREDIDWKNLDQLQCEYYEYIFHGVGVVFTEYRGCRSWFREGGFDEDHFGKHQQAFLDNLFKQNGKYESMNSTIFVTPLPVFFLAHTIGKAAHVVQDDIQEHWAYGAIPQMGKFLDLLRTWKERRDGRDIILVGGDVHVGGHTDVFYHDKPVFKHFTTSAINGQVVKKVEELILRLFQKYGKLKNGYGFKHHGWTKENNYGIVDVVNVNGNTHIEARLFCLDQTKKISEHTVDNNEEFKHHPACQCNMF